MRVTSLRNVCFSATGVTARYAAAIVKAINLPVCHYDLSAPCAYNYSLSMHNVGKHLQHCSEEHITTGIREVTLIGTPVFAGRIPRVVSQRLASITGAGNPAILFVTYGNRNYDDALLELCNQAESCGFIVVGAAAFVGQHSQLPRFAATRPNADDLAEAKAFALQCRTIIHDMIDMAHATVSLSPHKFIQGAFPYKARKTPKTFPSGDERCDNCQVCVLHCPVLAIQPETPRETGENCITCGRCIKYCHTGSRHLPSETLSALQERLAPTCSIPKQASCFYAAYENRH